MKDFHFKLESLITNDTEKAESIIDDILTIFTNTKKLEDAVSIGGNGDYELHLYHTKTKETLVSGNTLLTDDGGIFTSHQSAPFLKLTFSDSDYIQKSIDSN